MLYTSYIIHKNSIIVSLLLNIDIRTYVVGYNVGIDITKINFLNTDICTMYLHHNGNPLRVKTGFRFTSHEDANLNLY